jgi:hypothetical protein
MMPRRFETNIAEIFGSPCSGEKQESEASAGHACLDLKDVARKRRMSLWM